MKLRQALATSRKNRSRRYFPSREDKRYQNGTVFPHFQPRFGIDFEQEKRVFTIGSCFARNIEEDLLTLGVDVAAANYTVPRPEYAGRRLNGILNEYNPGTTAQRIIHAIDGTQSSDLSLLETDGGVHDLLLHAASPVTKPRALERRKEIFELYRNLKQADVVIVTLGLIESWFDNDSGEYLNRMPPNPRHVDPNRFEIVQLDVQKTMNLLLPAFQRLADAGKKVVISVSPVPLAATFFDNDCVVSNEYSKSVLRVCADQIYQTFPNVDYFPSYEIIRSAGTSSFGKDNVHVKPALVKRVTGSMVQAYTEAARGVAAPGSGAQKASGFWAKFKTALRGRPKGT